MMTIKRAVQLKNALLTPAHKQASPIMKAVAAGEPTMGPEEAVSQVAQAIMPQILKMNSGDSSELLSLFIANDAIKDVTMMLAARKAVDHLLEELGGEKTDTEQ